MLRMINIVSLDIGIKRELKGEQDYEQFGIVCNTRFHVEYQWILLFKHIPWDIPVDPIG